LIDKIINDVILSFQARWKVFAIAFGLVFLMVVLPYVGVRLPKLVSPVPTKADAFDKVAPKLIEKGNNFSVHKTESFVTPTLAAADYEAASSFIVMDFLSGNIIASKNSDTKVPIASLTKIMTAVVALDLADPSEEFTITKKAQDMIPTKIGVVAGQKMTLQELLNGALLTSANDAAQAIEDGINAKYGGDVFIRAMNTKAKDIGLKDSYFTNPQGLDDKHPSSSAEDLAVLSHYAMFNYPVIAQIVGKDYAQISANGDHKQFDLYNWNGLIGVYPGAMGMKIGNTDDAGYTSVVLSQREGKSILAVVLGAPGVLQRDMWASELLDLGFEKFNIAPAGITEQQFRDKYSSWQYWQ
jgi:serine-type D-Ala-D-Ala carboxypeptidase (penicillin-binding protein 5/6)